jgi:hypothetical protein
VLWSIYIQSLIPDQYCAPSSLLYSAYDNKVYLFLHGASWQALLPDGNTVADFNAHVAGWLLSFTPDGQFVEAKPVGDIEPSQLLGVFNPDWPFISIATSTVISPRLREGPNGTLYIGGLVADLDTIHFGGKTAIAAVLNPDLIRRNHFIAIYDRNTADWSQAFMTHSIGAYAGINDNAAPAWRVDTAGNVWIGLGLVAPERSGPGLLPTFCAIGNQAPETVPNRGYLAQFSPNGQLNWVAKSSNMYFHELQDNGKGGMFVLAGFIRAAGFQLPNGQYLGTTGLGYKDVLLAEISGSGEGIGFRAIGTAQRDQPIALARHKTTGDIYTVLVPNLNEYFQSPVPAPYVLQVYSTSGLCPVVGTRELVNAQIKLQVSPNPVAIGTPVTLQCYLSESSGVEARLYDMLGRQVWHSDLGQLPAGENKVVLEATGALQQGIYLLEMESSIGKGLIRMVLVD